MLVLTGESPAGSAERLGASLQGRAPKEGGAISQRAQPSHRHQRSSSDPFQPGSSELKERQQDKSSAVGGPPVPKVTFPKETQGK